MNVSFKEIIEKLSSCCGDENFLIRSDNEVLSCGGGRNVSVLPE